MADGPERCFYCGDSRGAEVEHFAPIVKRLDSTFLWPNLLLVCGPCNRQKGKAETWDGEHRLFLDPTLDEPWNHLVFVTETGLLAARYLADGTVDSLGNYTLETLDVLNHDAIADARRRVVRRLNTAVDHVLSDGDTRQTRIALLHAVDDDFFGIARWFVQREGRLEPRYLQLQTSDPTLWRRFSSAALRT